MSVSLPVFVKMGVVVSYLPRWRRGKVILEIEEETSNAKSSSWKGQR